MDALEFTSTPTDPCQHGLRTPDCPTVTRRDQLPRDDMHPRHSRQAASTCGRRYPPSRRTAGLGSALTVSWIVGTRGYRSWEIRASAFPSAGRVPATFSVIPATLTPTAQATNNFFDLTGLFFLKYSIETTFIQVSQCCDQYIRLFWSLGFSNYKPSTWWVARTSHAVLTPSLIIMLCRSPKNVVSAWSSSALA